MTEAIFTGIAKKIAPLFHRHGFTIAGGIDLKTITLILPEGKIFDGGKSDFETVVRWAIEESAVDLSEPINFVLREAGKDRFKLEASKK